MPGKMKFVPVGSTLVVVHDATTPSTEDWQSFLDYLHGDDGRGLTRIFVETRGGGPDLKQRGAYNHLIKRNNRVIKVAVLSDATVIRALVTAFGLIKGNDMRMFAMTDQAGAGRHLMLPPSEIAKIEQALVGLRRDIGVSAPARAVGKSP